MEKNLKRVVLGVIYCTAFFLPIVLSSPVHSQSFEWVKLLGTTSIDEGYGVAVDTSGNIYVTGLTYGNLGGETNVGGYYDAFLAKYDSSGTMKWVKLLGSKKWVDGTGVAVDTSGNIYVTGYTEGDLCGEINTGYQDAFLAKYDSLGTVKWVKLLGTKSDDEGYGVAVDTSGNIYVTGATGGDLGGEPNAGDDDAFLAKYDSSGTMKWVKLGVIASDDDAYAYGVAVDTSGNIYVTGVIGEAGYTQYNMGSYDAFLAKYDSSGTVKWVKLLGSAWETGWGDEGNGVTVDTSGNIYITGDTWGDLGGETNAGNYDVFLAKYEGSFPWELFYPAFIKKK